MASETKHKYEYAVDTTSQTAPSHVVSLVGTGKRVMEIGCGPGSITKMLSSQGGCTVTGVEVDPEAIKKVSPFCEQVVEADLNSETWPDLLQAAGKFDVVVAADVLEHLYDPWKTLPRMASFLNENGYLVISLPHVGHAAVASCLFNGDFEYREWGLLDRTHIRFFGLTNIEDLFRQSKLKIVEARFVIKPPEDTEFATQWASLPTSVKAAFRLSPHSDVYQVVVRAVPLDYEGIEINLLPPKSSRPRFSGLKYVRGRIGSQLSASNKAFIRRIAAKFGFRI